MSRVTPSSHNEDDLNAISFTCETYELLILSLEA